MCGIVGYIGKDNAINVVIAGLERLEYRGYDSAGIAYVKENNVEIIKEKGRIANLKNLLDFNIYTSVGIGHTRWATHGEANKINSHPHKVGKFTIVHNGIIENYLELKNMLIEDGYEFKSETDTEVACALIDYLYKKNESDIIKTLIEFKKQTVGAYALGIISDDDINKIYAIKKESPLIIATNDNGNLIASDVPSILKFAKKYIVLKDNEFAIISEDEITIYDENNNIREFTLKEFDKDLDSLDKGAFKHYMIKEIFEQPSVVRKTLDKYIKSIDDFKNNLPNFSKYNKIYIVACGSAYHAGLVGKSLIEEYANTEVIVDVASEFRYKNLFVDDKTLVIIVSQSGETADSLAALKIAKEKGSHTIAIVNVYESSIARESDEVIYTEAGSEIAVATTKAYSAQVSIFILIALKLSYEKNIIDDDKLQLYLTELNDIDININKALKIINYKDIAKKIYNKENIFFIGRKLDYALSLEGALKLKEISYINAQAYASGELKHGTISLIDKGTPVIAIVTDKDIASKTISNIKETKARGSFVIVISTDDIYIDKEVYDELIVIPSVIDLYQALLTIIPLQLLSYEIADNRGCDIDKPKNLAKSVTVE